MSTVVASKTVSGWLWKWSMQFELRFHKTSLYSLGQFVPISVDYRPYADTLERISATDWLEESLPNEKSWKADETVKLAGILADRGIDFLDVSSGGSHPSQRFKNANQTAYQAFLAEKVKKAVGNKLVVGCVGGITDGYIAQGILDKEQADVVLVGRYFQKNPGAVWTFAQDLNVDIHLAHQIEWGTCTYFFCSGFLN